MNKEEIILALKKLGYAVEEKDIIKNSHGVDYSIHIRKIKPINNEDSNICKNCGLRKEQHNTGILTAYGTGITCKGFEPK